MSDEALHLIANGWREKAPGKWVHARLMQHGRCRPRLLSEAFEQQGDWDAAAHHRLHEARPVPRYGLTEIHSCVECGYAPDRCECPASVRGSR